MNREQIEAERSKMEEKLQNLLDEHITEENLPGVSERTTAALRARAASLLARIARKPTELP